MRLATLFAVLTAVALLAVWSAPMERAVAQDAGAGSVYVLAGEVHTGARVSYAPGAVLIQDGRVTAVGLARDVERPKGVRVIDTGPHATVVPGFVAAYSQHLDADGVDAASVAPDVRAIDAFDPFADESRLLSAGITTAFLSPGNQRVVTGRGAIVKLAGGSPSTRTLAAVHGLVGGVGASVQRPPAMLEPPSLPDATIDPLLPHRAQLPVTRAGSLLLLRRLLTDAKAGTVDLGGVESGNAPFFLSAHTEADLRAALAFAEETGVRLVLVGAHGAGPLVDEIAAAGHSVVFEWPGAPGTLADENPERLEARATAREVPARLSAAGVPFALTTSDDRTLHDLHFVAAQAARHGLGTEDALAAITADAAQLLGIEGRAGVLRPGAAGDLVVLSGRPTELRSFPLRTIVGGEVVWERTARGRTTIVRAAEVHLGDGRVLRPGEVAFEDGVVVEVGDRVGVPPGARYLDLGEGTVVPGFIDALSHAGFAGAGTDANRDVSTGVDPAGALRFTDAAFDRLARAGVTTALVAPGGSGRVTGRAAVVKTLEADGTRRIVRKDAGLLVRLAGERNLPGAVGQLNKSFDLAKKYQDSLAKYAKEQEAYEKWKQEQEAARKKAEAEAAKKKAEAKDAAAKGEEKPAEKEQKPEEKKPPVEPTANPDLAAYKPYLEGKRPVLVRAETVEELRAALAFGKQWKLRLIVVGGADVRRVEVPLDKAEAGVIAAPRVLHAGGGERVNLLRELALSGLPAAVGSDAHAGGAELREVLAYAVAHGLSPATAIRMATGDAAKLLGVERRVGTLAPGKDADLVLLTGAPFASGTRVQTVYVGGREVGGE